MTEILKIIAHNGERVYACQYSPDEKFIVSCSQDNSVKLWDASNGQLVKQLGTHDDQAVAVKFSPDGKLIASGSYDKTIKLWNVQDGSLVNTLVTKDYVISLAFSPDGKQLASGSHWNVEISLWNVQTGELLNTLKGHQNRILDLNYSNDGQLLASSSADGMNAEFKIWKVQTGKDIVTSSDQGTWLRNVLFTADNKQLITGLSIHDVQTGEKITEFEGGCGLAKVDLSHDSQQIVLASDDGNVRLYSAQDNYKSIQKEFVAHSDNIRRVQFSNNDKQLLTCSDDGTIKVWQL